jgi:hypothetical protein
MVFFLMRMMRMMILIIFCRKNREEIPDYASDEGDEHVVADHHVDLVEDE